MNPLTSKPGVRTSEFWLGVVGAAVMIANKGLGLGLGLPEETIMSFAAVVVSYIGGRSVVKLARPRVG